MGKTISLYTGQVGDEGWFAIRSIPYTWKNTGPYDNGLKNYLYAGYGLGSGNDPEKYLDEIPYTTPLRAKGLSMLKGYRVLAVVYDSDISINYDPNKANLQGDNLGIVAFEVIGIEDRYKGSELPAVTLKILDAEEIRKEPIYLFSNAPELYSSSEPYDTKPYVYEEELKPEPAH